MDHLRASFTLLTIDGDKLPTEFRIFGSGWNATAKGEFLFDDEAAEQIMSAYREHGTDIMIDLEHLSVAAEEVTGDARNFDSDARGWCSLAVRNGELWAVNVSWTPDGAKRLKERRQRYVSPAFATDEEMRPIEIHNVALTSIPATHQSLPLVASRTINRGLGTMTPEQMILLARLVREGKTPEQVLQILSMDVKTLQAVVKAMGGDPSGDLATLIGTITAFAQELADAATGKTPEPTPEPVADALAEGAPEEEDETLTDGEAAPPKDEEETASLMRAIIAKTGKTTLSDSIGEIERWKKSALEQAQNQAILAAERKVLESNERRDLIIQLIKLGKESPATAWVNSDGKTPAGYLATIPLAELRERVQQFKGAPNTETAGTPMASPITQTNLVELSEYEQNRIRSTAKRHNTDYDVALAKYIEVKEQQTRGAKPRGNQAQKLLSRKLEQGHVLANTSGRFGHSELTLLSTPVQPIEQFGASSQRALEEFRLEYNATLASLPMPWSETIGTVLPGGSLKDTYPITFDAVKYRERIAQNAVAGSSQSADVSVNKKEFSAAKQAELRRITRGDFAYVKTWQNNAATMARARINMRNHLVTDLLEAGTSGYWGVTADQPTGIDGQPFFSATHKVNPFDEKVQFHGGATWSNYQSAATPLSAANLTQEKGAMLYIPGPDGEEMGTEVSGMLIPTRLVDIARNLLTVQDLILSGALSGGGDGTMGTVKNEHYMSGLEYTWAPQLAGTDSTANYYLYSMDTINQGNPPWVLAEDAAEEIRTWDETSDFYKDSGWIKLESIVLANAVLLYPHGIRYIKGS